MINNGFDFSQWGKVRVDLLAGMSLGDLLGKGTRGEVYTADNGSTPVAIKVMRDYARKVYSCDERYKRDYLLSIARELHLLQAGSDAGASHVAKLYSSYLSPDKKDLYFVLEKADRAVRNALQEGLPETVARGIARHLLTALAFVHDVAGYAHLDVCSDNVLLVVGRDNRAILADFGFCRPLSTGLHTADVVALGYRAPELLFLGGFGGASALIANLTLVDEQRQRQLEGIGSNPQYDLAKADIFAVGIFLCEMLLGRIPVTANVVAPGAAAAKDGTQSPAPVDGGKAARLQFLALLKNLVPSFDKARWEEKQAEFAKYREQFPTEASSDDEVPLGGLGFTDDDITDIKIKPKIIEGLLDDAKLSPAGCAFLKLLLAEDPANRPSAAQLLKHEWLAEGADAERTVTDTTQARSMFGPSWEKEALALQDKSHDELVAWVEARCSKLTPSQHVMVAKS